MENAPSLSCLNFGVANIEAMKDISSGSCKASQSQNFELGSATECVDLVVWFPWCNTICTTFFFVKGQLTISDTSIIFNPWNSLRSSLYSCYSEGTSTNFRSWVPLFWSHFARQSMPQNERQDGFRVVNESRILICNLGEFYFAGIQKVHNQTRFCWIRIWLIVYGTPRWRRECVRLRASKGRLNPMVSWTSNNCIKLGCDREHEMGWFIVHIDKILLLNEGFQRDQWSCPVSSHCSHSVLLLF